MIRYCIAVRYKVGFTYFVKLQLLVIWQRQLGLCAY